MLKGLTVIVLGVTTILLLACSSYAFRDNIVAAWSFEEGSGKKTGDVSGNGNDGELVGGADWVDGKFGKALHFDGSSGYVEIPFDDSMKVLNEGDFTLAAWFMPDEIPSENKEVFQQGDKNGTGRTWLFVHSDNEIRSYLGGAATQSGVSVEGDTWYHTAMVVTEGGGTDTVQLYVDGVMSGAPFQAGMEDSEGSYFIGCHKDLTNFWDGVIDEVVLINKALSEGEINDLMSNGVAAVLAVDSAGKLTSTWGSFKDNAGL